MKDLALTLIQFDIQWESVEANLEYIENQLLQIDDQSQVMVLPEMFNTGFSMHPEKLAEKMDGSTISWMKDAAKKYNKVICGSLIVEDEGQFVNRFVWASPDGEIQTYDKYHLFTLAGEEKVFAPGNQTAIIEYEGWRIKPLICYDLRFPVWAAHTKSENTDFDLLLYVANWPEKRAHAWRTLLQARAIENQTYCIGVNRVGEDGNGYHHIGDTSAIDPWGHVLFRQSYEACCQTVTLSASALQEIRETLPFTKDAVPFNINL